MNQLEELQSKKNDCLTDIQNSDQPEDGLYCPMIWDGAYCWPYIPAGTVHSVSCPEYIHGFNTQAQATKFCTNNGQWWISEKTNRSWTNYSLCTSSEFIFSDLNSYHKYLLKSHLSNIKLISKIGYSVSFSTLIVAFLILASIRKLRCPRNSLHMHLFFSFIMRALMFFLKDALFIEGVGFSSNIDFSGDNISHFLHDENNIDCKVFTSFWQYFLMANYCWILIEGLYLHNLIFLSMFTDTSSIRHYAVLGWGLPIIVIIPWIIVRATLENTLCWTTNKNVIYFWIIRGPITLSILINFIFFVNITRVLFLKMFSQGYQVRCYRYRKWFKSTLILVPLFGVHYALLLAVSVAASVNKIIELIWLYIDQFFSAFQGSFVALLYCFFNGEVQAEIKKLLQTEPNHSKCFSHTSFLTQSLTYLSRGRNSIQSLHSATDKKDGYQCTSPSVYIPRQDDNDITSMTMTQNTTSPFSHSTTDVVITFKDCTTFNHENIKISNSDHQLSNTKESLL